MTDLESSNLPGSCKVPIPLKYLQEVVGTEKENKPTLFLCQEPVPRSENSFLEGSITIFPMDAIRKVISIGTFRDPG